MTFFKTSLKIEFEVLNSSNEERFLEEYLALNKSAEVARFKKLAAKIDFSEAEEFLFQMLLNIKKDLSDLKLNQKEKLLKLENQGFANEINFEHIQMSAPCFKPLAKYYARVEIRTQILSFFIETKDAQIAEISKIKAEEKALWDNFVVQMQRDMIKDLRSKNER